MTFTTTSIQNLFEPQNLIFDLKCKSKKEAITKLVTLINNNYQITNSLESFIKEFIKREKKGSTGLPNGIAVPHIKVDTLSRFYLAIGLHHKGMDFDSIDGNSTYVIFLLMVPSSETSMHLTFLSIMSRLFLQKDFKDRIMEQKTAENICGFLQKIFHN